MKSCLLDPWPTFVMKECSNIISAMKIKENKKSGYLNWIRIIDKI